LRPSQSSFCRYSSQPSPKEERAEKKKILQQSEKIKKSKQERLEKEEKFQGQMVQTSINLTKTMESLDKTEEILERLSTDYSQESHEEMYRIATALLILTKQKVGKALDFCSREM
jgi:carbonic anhydrase